MPEANSYDAQLDRATTAWAAANAVCWQGFAVFAAAIAVLLIGVRVDEEESEGL